MVKPKIKPTPKPPTTSTKRGRPAISNDKRREMREVIAASTKELFQNEGYRQISMRRIASEVGCSPMTLYKYYDSKIDILHTLWADVFKAVFNELNKLEIAKKSPREQLLQLATAYIQYWLDNSEHYRLVFMTEGVDQPEVGNFIEDPEIVAHYQVFAIAIMNASAEETPESELIRKNDALVCFMHGIAHNLITVSQYDWTPSDYLIEMAVRGTLD